MKTVLLGSAFLLFAQAAHASCGTFEVSKGDVKIQKAGGASSAASVGAKICAGETVMAGESARAKIKMEDGNELNVSPNSKIVIETYQYDPGANKKKVMLNVLKGKVRATTREENMYNDKAKDGQANTFQIRTKSAVAGVRGTDFLTSFDPSKGKMEVVTFRGKVEVGQLSANGSIANSVFVAVGQKTVVVSGKTPEIPKALPSNELMKQNTETRNEAPASGASTAPPTVAPAQGKQDQAASPTSPLTPSPAETRAPAAAIGGSLITAGDLPSTGSTVLPKLPTAPAAPQLPTAVLNNNIIINNTIQNRKATVNLNLRIKN